MDGLGWVHIRKHSLRRRAERQPMSTMAATTKPTRPARTGKNHEGIAHTGWPDRFGSASASASASGTSVGGSGSGGGGVDGARGGGRRGCWAGGGEGGCSGHG